MYRRFTLALVLLSSGSMSPAPLAEGSSAGAQEEGVTQVVRANNTFALELYARLAGSAGGGDVFFSPASISTALAMTLAGARGETAAEMVRTLHLDATGDRLHEGMGRLAGLLSSGGADHELAIANALWGQRGFEFRDAFLELTRERYGAGLREVDYAGAAEQARAEINAWVEERTQQRIRELIKPGMLDAATRLVLTNAIYFKGTWRTQFDAAQTRPEPFHLASGSKLVPTMHLRDQTFPFVHTAEVLGLELPYAGDETSMVLLVPRRGVPLSTLERTITEPVLRGWLDRLRPVELQDVAIPRFKMTLEYDLARELVAMGMALAFRDQADFSGISAQAQLQLSRVVHKAFVEVNEEGTEAAAATGVAVRLTSAVVEPSVFRADRPFLFLIRERATGAILFLGRVTGSGLAP